MANEDEQPRSRAVDENPVRRRADSRRIRSVEDAPLPEPQKPAKARGLSVIRPGDAVLPTPSTELPPEWLPPKADPTRPASRRLAPGDETSAPAATSPPPPETTTTPALIERLRQRPAAVAGGAVVAAVLLLLVIGRDATPGPGSKVFSDADLLALAGVWKAQGTGTWGGRTKSAELAAEVVRVGRAVAAGLDAPDENADVVVVDTAGSVHGFTLPDGTVVLTTGLLWRLESEAELAAAIAHLAAHHRLGHVARLVDEPAEAAERARSLLATPASARAPADTELLIAVASASATAKNEGPLERDADVVAARALAAAGYDQSALARLPMRLAPPAAFAAQHPAPPLRTTPLKALPATGRVDVDRYVREVLGRLDRVRGPEATPATPPPPEAPAPVPPVVEPAPDEPAAPAPPAAMAAPPEEPPTTTPPPKKKKKKAPPRKRR